jgi:hypothetical protein
MAFRTPPLTAGPPPAGKLRLSGAALGDWKTLDVWADAGPTNQTVINAQSTMAAAATGNLLICSSFALDLKVLGVHWVKSSKPVEKFRFANFGERVPILYIVFSGGYELVHRKECPLRPMEVSFSTGCSFSTQGPCLTRLDPYQPLPRGRKLFKKKNKSID